MRLDVPVSVFTNVGGVARSVAVGVWLTSGSAMADGSAAEAVIDGRIDWVTAHGTRPSSAKTDVEHDLHFEGDLVIAVPRGSDTSAVLSSTLRAATLYMAMDGITLYPSCPTGAWPHSAFDCTHIVDQPTMIPPVSSETAKTQLLQAVRNHLAAFDIAVTTERPPPYLPYLLAAIGGDGAWAGGGLCGQATLSCAGQRRNLVSVNFPGNQNCNDIASTIAHELGHNLGLEHTSLQADTMFPGAVQPRSPQDVCSTIQLADDKVAPSCPSSHAQQCPEANGNQQNTWAELSSRVGERRHDVDPPTIFQVSPPNGSVFTTEDVIEVTARVEDEGGALGVRWRWVEGLPNGVDAYEQCTNDACELAFSPDAHASNRWDLVTLNGPPVGEYAFELDAVDAYGNAANVMVWFRVEEPAEEPDEEDDDEETTGDDGDPFDDIVDLEDEEVDDDALPPGYGDALDADYGCGCRGAPSRPTALLILAPYLLARRRRRSR